MGHQKRIKQQRRELVIDSDVLPVGQVRGIINELLHQDAALYAYGLALATILAYVEGTAGMRGNLLRLKLGLGLSAKYADKIPESVYSQLQFRPHAGKSLRTAYDELRNEAARQDHLIQDHLNGNEGLYQSTTEAFQARIDAYIPAINAVQADSDNGEQFQNVISSFDPVYETSIDEAFKFLRTGRKKGATPLTQFILDKERWIRQAYGTQTNSDTFARMMESLASDSAVQQWIEFKRREKITDPHLLRSQPLAVQAYEKYDGLDRYEGGEQLRQMKKDHP